ncbi:MULTISPECIES: 5-formyltetrahydrofolate cyclo-ligase [Paenibacillus]|uniref:5-formyltetrahydrofolate cyclo-ligase n=1 Tax=Paenibacillus TaxID=44249 RepID=UPI002FE2C849
MDIKERKKELRAHMAGVRSSIPEAVRQAEALAACLRAEQEVLGPLRARKGAPLTVFSYLSFRDEPDTTPLLRNCRDRGDRILVPRVSGGGVMTLHRLNGAQDLIEGLWGIPEPNEKIPIWPVSRYGELDVILVPGLAFDRLGGRIGYGGGYYDRFMSVLGETSHAVMSCGSRRVLKTALAYRELIVKEPLPMEEHDFRLDMLFTASGTIYIEGK